MWEKFRMPIFGHSEFIPVFLGKIVGKKFGTAIFGHSEFRPVFLGKIVEKNLEWLFHIFSVHITSIECNGLESNKICTFLDFYSEI